jgi:hypothetical protein
MTIKPKINDMKTKKKNRKGQSFSNLLTGNKLSDYELLRLKGGEDPPPFPPPPPPPPPPK